VDRRAALLLGLSLAGPGSVGAQSFELVPETRSALVGDPVAFRATIRLAPGQALIDPAPRPLLPPGDGIRFLAADTLRPQGDGALQGTVRLAFYRPGLQPVPLLALLYRSGRGEAPETLVHPSVAIDITPVLPAGNPELKDIKGLIRLGGWGSEVALALLALLGLGLLLLRRTRAPAPVSDPAPSPLRPGPFAEAIAQLQQIEQADWPAHGEVVRHYEAVADLLRRCLEEAGQVPTRAATTPEVVSGLPPRLAFNGQVERCRLVLTEADLVKFAQVRPDPVAARSYLAEARRLLNQWNEAAMEASGAAG
jgi:hypothetical protein